MNRRFLISVAILAVVSVGCSSGSPLPDKVATKAEESNQLSKCWAHDLLEYRDLAENLPRKWQKSVDKASALYEKWAGIIATGKEEKLRKTQLNVGWIGLDGMRSKTGVLRVVISGNGRCRLSDPPLCEEVATLAYRNTYENLISAWRIGMSEIDDAWGLAVVSAGSFGGVEDQAFREAARAMRSGFMAMGRAINRFEKELGRADVSVPKQDCSDGAVAVARSSDKKWAQEAEPRTLHGFEQFFSSIKGYKFLDPRAEARSALQAYTTALKKSFGELLDGTVGRSVATTDGDPMQVGVIVSKFDSGVFDKYGREGILQDVAKASDVPITRLHFGDLTAYELETPFGTTYVFWAAENAVAVIVGFDAPTKQVAKAVAEFGQPR